MDEEYLETRLSEHADDIRELGDIINNTPSVVSVDDVGYDTFNQKLVYEIHIFERKTGVRVWADDDESALTTARDLFAATVGSLMQQWQESRPGHPMEPVERPAGDSLAGPGVAQRPFPES
jgi:hypothetical protein